MSELEAYVVNLNDPRIKAHYFGRSISSDLWQLNIESLQIKDEYCVLEFGPYITPKELSRQIDYTIETNWTPRINQLKNEEFLREALNEE